MAMTGNITTDSTELIQTYFRKLALKAEKPFVILDQFAVKSEDIPKYEGYTIKWWKPLPIPVSATNLGGLTEGISPSAVDLQFQNVTATVKGYGHVVAVSEFLGFTSIDPELKSKVESLGIHRGKVVDRLHWTTLAQNLYPMRVDADSTYEFAGADDASGTSSTVLINDATQASATTYDGAVVVVTSGNNKGMGGYCPDNAATEITISTTVPSYALNEACASGDTFKIANSTAITAADPLTCAAVDKAVTMLNTFHTLPFDGYFVGVLSPFTQYDIRNDSAWVNADQYAGSKKLYNGEVGEWGGVRFVLDTLPWRSAAGTMGTYSATGAVFHTPIFGQQCYGKVGITGVQDEIIIHNKKQTGDNLEMFSTAGWKAYLVSKVLNATWGVQIIHGATSIS